MRMVLVRRVGLVGGGVVSVSTRLSGCGGRGGERC